MHAEEVDIGRLVEQAYGAFGDEARRREIDYQLDEDGDAPTIVTDGDRVLQVITNLLANAFRWTPDGGTDRRLRSTRRTAGRPRRRVSDTARGSRPTSASAIFVRSSRATPTAPGSGLPIARELAGALGGSIELESTVGEGSRFRLVLPVERGR